MHAHTIRTTTARAGLLLAAAAMLVALLAGLAGAMPAAAAPTPPTSTAPIVKARATAPTPRLLAVRSARHDGYDRIVFDFDTGLPGYDIRYVDRVVQDGSGAPVVLEGRAFLQVVLTPAVAHDDAGGSPPRIAATRPRYPALRQVAAAGDFEAHVTFGLGVADRTGFRVLELSNPSRLVIDIAHRAAPLLRRGSRGAAVADWQRELNGVRPRPIAVDGVFGPATRRATQEFQRSAGLTADGVVGPRTRAAMAAALAGR